MYVDSHCHLIFPELQSDLPGVLGRMREQRVTHALCVAVKLEESAPIQALVDAHDHLYRSIGVHPSETGCEEPTLEHLVTGSTAAKVVAIGETGLDYHWHPEAPEWQRARFRTHIQAARAVGKPLIIHTRDAAQDTLAILAQERAGEAGGVMHCFTETLEVARAALDLGLYISFSGIVTFKNASALREVAAVVPMDRLLIETDAPYLAPAPHRGRTNEPSYVVHVAAEIARIKALPVERIAEQTTANFFGLFGIPRH